MSNIPQKFHLVTKPGINFSPAPALFLDTLAQLPRNEDDRRLLRRARSKYFTQKITNELARIGSPLTKYYWNAYHCNDELVQAGLVIKGKYCNTRVCNNCNRIRTAKMINGYKLEIDNLQEKQFLTLSRPSVHADALPGEIEHYYKCWRKIMRRFQDAGRVKKWSIYITPIKLAGIRKLEVTFNNDRESAGLGCYHPHFHLIVAGKENARLIQAAWLEFNPGADIRANKYVPVVDDSMLELFKYATKVVDANTSGVGVVHIEVLDTIMRALYKRRIVQPFGAIKKEVSEDVDHLQAEIYTNIPEYESMVWQWYKQDWVNEYGELLTGHEPGEVEKIVFKTRRSAEVVNYHPT